MTLEMLVIVVYLAMLVVVGLTYKSLNKDASDYFRSGGQGAWWLVGVSAFMSGFSAWTFTGAAGVAFEGGWSVSIIFISNALGFFANAVCFGPWFRQLRAITVPEVVRDRFGPATQQFFAWSNVPMRLLYAALGLYGLAIFSSSMFGFHLQATIIVVGIIVLIYSAAGGSWGVMATDFLQSTILIPITILLAVLCLIKVGGFSGLFDMIQQQGLTEHFSLIKHATGSSASSDYTWPWTIAMFLQGFFLSNSLGSATRYFAAKDGNHARYAAVLGGVLMLLGGWIWFIPPIVARLYYAPQVNAAALAKPAEAAYAVASTQLLPHGMVGLMIVAMFAATLSSMDTGLNQTSAIFTNDIIPSIRRWMGRKPLTPVAALRIGQALSITCGVIIIGLAVQFSLNPNMGIFEYMLNVCAMLALPLSIPTLLALFVRRTPWWACLVSILCAMIPSVASAFASETWTFQTKVFLISAAGTAGYFITMPFWRTASAAYRAQVDEFFTRMHTPVVHETPVGSSADWQQLTITGRFGLIVGGLILLLMIPKSPMSDKIQVLAVAGSILLISSILFFSGRVQQRKSKRNLQSPPAPSPDLAGDTELSSDTAP